MKIIHCGDIHLDSAMKTNLTGDQAKERKNEILLTFTRMVEYAKSNDVKVIMIAGDLFDNNSVSARTRNVVKGCIDNNPQIDFLYIKGNHDVNSFLNSLEEIPQNLKLFTDKWSSYRYGNVVITGVELDKNNTNTIYSSLILNKNDFNIVLMHGQESQYLSKDKTEVINLNTMKNKNVDYLALGHIHTYKVNTLDQRGIYCYCGCLEGRGYDECGAKGFVLLDIDNGKLEHKFIDFSRRVLCEVSIDIWGTETTNDVDSAISKATDSISAENLVKLVLVGNVSVDSERNINYLMKKYNDKFYSLKIYDQTKLAVNIEDYKYDASLKGEFIRLVLEQDYTEQEKKDIIETGLKALAGEELE